MLANILLHTEDEGVTLSGPVVRALLQRGDGDAALLYLSVLRHHGTVSPRSLAGELRWERGRIEAAEKILQELKLLASPADTVPPAPADEKPEYSADEVSDRLEQSQEFRELTAEVERKLGKKLSTPDVSVLLGLYDFLGLPADVIYLLVCHCTERIRRRYGEGRRPGMKQVEREGYAWARMGIDTQEEAADYLKRYTTRQEALPRYMRVLQLSDRAPVPSEEKYLTAWQEMGFSPEVVALAYDKTVFHCHELKWQYLNSILKRWHAAGTHTVSEIEAQDQPETKRKKPAEPPERSGGNMRKYVQNLQATGRANREKEK